MKVHRDWREASAFCRSVFVAEQSLPEYLLKFLINFSLEINSLKEQRNSLIEKNFFVNNRKNFVEDYSVYFSFHAEIRNKKT
ncbi:hypothetical protein ABH966_000414 [Lysinibacillus sp. RC46]|uniref:hypothetical protein n=1 Tax=unclassified Lysinibacillus TaxID=2636778 RepID=UPI003514B4E9